MMSEGQELAVEIGAAVIGTAQPFLLRTYADTTYGTLIPQIGAYGTPSCLAGIVAGGAATIAGIASLLYGKGIQDRALAKIALSYGVPAVTASLIIAYMTPTIATQAKSQAVFSPQKAAASGAQAATTAAARNLAALTPQQRSGLGVY